jgi:uncharacterized protein
MKIEVVIAWPERQLCFPVELPAGATAWDAIRASGILDVVKDLDPTRTPIGVFAQPVGPEAVLHEGDRVEIYRPLLADPKDSRRRRVATKRRSG